MLNNPTESERTNAIHGDLIDTDVVSNANKQQEISENVNSHHDANQIINNTEIVDDQRQNKSNPNNTTNTTTTTTSTAVNNNNKIEEEEELNETTRDIIQKIRKLGEEPSSPTESPYIDFAVDCDCTVAGAALRNGMDIDDFLNANPEYSLLDRLDGGTKVKIKNEKHFEQRIRREERKSQIYTLMKQLEDEERKQEERKKKEEEERLALQIQSQQAVLQEIGRRSRASSNATNKESHLTTSAFNFADNVVESVGNTAVNIASGVAHGVGNVTRASTNVVGSVASGMATGVGTVASGVSNGVGTVASGVGSVAESVASGVASVGKGFWNIVGFRSRSGSNAQPFVEELDDRSPPISPNNSSPKQTVSTTTTTSNIEVERTRGRSSSFLSILPFTGEVIEPYITPPQKSSATSKTVGTPTEDHNHLSTKSGSPPVQQFHYPKNLHHDMMMHFKTPQVLEATSPVSLKESQLRELSLSFPLRFRNKNLVLLYSTQEHGISLLTLYRKVAENQPIIIVVETTHGEVFGAFLTCEIELTKRVSFFTILTHFTITIIG